MVSVNEKTLPGLDGFIKSVNYFYNDISSTGTIFLGVGTLFYRHKCV